MKTALLIDMGSTFTKVTAVDIEAPRILGTARAGTTVTTDVTEGIRQAVADVNVQSGLKEYDLKLACSSAAGGLRMVAVGLVPELTAEAARLAALGAGAKVLRTYSYELNEAELNEIRRLQPEIILLSGGTDGGNRDTIIHNARQLGRLGICTPVVLAGNKTAADEARKALSEGGLEVTVTDNVLPSLGQIHVAPVREAIREVFLRRIVQAKGLDRARAFVDDIVMPTPAAVLEAIQLLATGCPGQEGLGDLMAVDVGGATTDVYSMAKGEPSQAGTIWRGLPEPYAKRTVEGDLGVRSSAGSVIEAGGVERVAISAEITPERIKSGCAIRTAEPWYLPDSAEECRLDEALARVAIALAVERHCGRITVQYTPFGAVSIQKGKDLTKTRWIVATGGPVIGAPDPAGMVRAALKEIDDPITLAPKEAGILMDPKYITAAMGLLATRHPGPALSLLKAHLVA